MYWYGNKEFVAYGMGAVSLIDRSRFQRPLFIRKYYQFI